MRLRQLPHHLPLRSFPHWGRVLFAFTLLVRGWVLWRATGVDSFVPDQGDMKFYNDWARRIAGGEWTDHRAFYGLPLYPYLLAGVYGLVGFQPYLALLPQVLAEACTAALLFRCAGLAFTPTVGSGGARAIGGFAALGWVFFVPAQAFATILMPTVYLILVFWFVVWWVLAQRGLLAGPGRFFAMGLLIGFVAMGVANILFLVPLLLASIALGQVPVTLGHRAAWGRRAVAAGLLLAGVTVGTAPCALHNRLAAGDPVFLSAHSGVNFWIGNHPDANGYPRLPPGLPADQEGLLRDSITQAEAAVGHPLRRGEVSAFWSSQAYSYIAAHPAAWGQLLLLKLRNFWSVFRYDDLSIISQLVEDGVTLPGLGFGLVAALGLPGLALAWAQAPRARWIVAAVSLHMVSLLTVFVTERYRMAAVPGLLLLAGYGLWRLGSAVLAERRITVGLVYAALLTGSVILVYWPQRDPSLLALDDYNTGVADTEAGRLERAGTKLERVAALTPDSAEVQFALGNLRLAQGNPGAAKASYRRTLELDPNHARVLNNLGVLALEEDRAALAEQFLVRAVAIRGPNANTLYLLAQARLRTRNFDGAREAIDAALLRQPGRKDFAGLRSHIPDALP